MFRSIFLALLLLTQQASAQYQQCPDRFPQECSCTDEWGTEIKCITTELETWDIQATFDEISDLFSGNKSVSAVYIDGFLLEREQEIPAHSISTLKPIMLYIFGWNKFTRIDPEAFSGCHDSLEYLYIYEMDLPAVQEAFDLFNNFKSLRGLGLGSTSRSTTLLEIPTHAFNAALVSLTDIYMMDIGLQSIGEHAFADLINLEWVDLQGNELTLANISKSAFVFAKTGVNLLLQDNPGITHLPQELFGDYLKDDLNTIVVGADCRYGYCDPSKFLFCDERVDWICETRITGIIGYYCRESEYDDIFEYCRKKFRASRFHREEKRGQLKELALADRMYRETFYVEERYSRGATRQNKRKRPKASRITQWGSNS